MWNFLRGFLTGATAINLVDNDPASAAPAKTDPAAAIAELRHHLSLCQAAAEQQRQRADLYYDLYCESVRANADLRRNGGGQHHAA